jgi:hypothetical protein
MRFFSLRHHFQTVSGAHPGSYQMATGALSEDLKRPGRETDHLPPSRAELKNAGVVSPLLQYVYMAWCFDKHRDNFTFTLSFYLKHNWR